MEKYVVDDDADILRGRVAILLHEQGKGGFNLQVNVCRDSCVVLVVVLDVELFKKICLLSSKVMLLYIAVIHIIIIRK